MAQKQRQRAEVVERGNIYFLYRPRIGEHEPEGLDDVQRFYLVLEPEGGAPVRLIVIGRKRLPDIDDHERHWATVEATASRASEVAPALGEQRYDTKTRGERTVPAARPAGEGSYLLVRHGRELHLAYELELPERPGPVQEALNIAPAASFVVSIANPERRRGSPARRAREERPSYPDPLQECFHGRRFAGEEPRLLDYEGAELLLIGASEDPEEELDVTIEARHESARQADIFKHLKLQAGSHPREPLLRGRWA
jgi:hypothetical protein